MSNETCTVTIADIYGAEWWARNKEELDREWEGSLGVSKPGTKVLNISMQPINPREYATAIILHRRKPKPPTLLEVYGADEVTIPAGWEWTGEWRVPVTGDAIVTPHAKIVAHVTNDEYTFAGEYSHRLILRERPKKVWYRAEEKERLPNIGDWVWFIDLSWKLVEDGVFIPRRIYLCATRHEEIDQTVQVVTQVDVERVVGR